jgi:hypothetical protein
VIVAVGETVGVGLMKQSNAASKLNTSQLSTVGVGSGQVLSKNELSKSGHIESLPVTPNNMVLPSKLFVNTHLFSDGLNKI